MSFPCQRKSSRTSKKETGEDGPVSIRSDKLHHVRSYGNPQLGVQQQIICGVGIVSHVHEGKIPTDYGSVFGYGIETTG